MVAAFLTALFFALSGVTGQKVAFRLGAQWGNFIRLVIAVVVLGGVTWSLFPESLHAKTFTWFFLSGLIGFGLGDVALFAAYSRLGSRLTILLTLCLAPVFALIIEWLWLGSHPTARVMVCVATILAGVGLAILLGSGKRTHRERIGSFPLGVVAALIAGFGQGAGAVVSRKAEAVAGTFGVEIHGVSAAFQRVFAGVVVALLTVVALRFFGKQRLMIPTWAAHRKVTGWMLGAALFGPAVGVSCFQWALKSQESGVVLAVVALTPVVMMPMSAVTEGDRPGLWAVIGALLAVGGVVALYLWV
ncbi:MAG: DMT family transporter [Verrucomicrobiales bacterium]|nr:DMT family transporter [Verrucomicrobiales bacterium]